MSRLLPHIQSAPHAIEDGGVGAHENDGVPIVSAGQSHFDPGSGGGLAGQFDLVKVSEQAVPIGGCSEQADAGVREVDIVGSAFRVGDDDGNAEFLAAGSDDGDGVRDLCVGGDKPSDYFHVEKSSGNPGVIDWSPLAGRRVVFHPDAEAA